MTEKWYSGPKRLIKFGVVLVLVSRVLNTLIHFHTSEHDAWIFENGGFDQDHQVPVFYVVFFSFISPILAPFIHMKMWILNDLLPHDVESWIVNHGGRLLLTPSGDPFNIDDVKITNYADERHWAMKPGKGDTSKATPPGLKNCQDAGICDAADVFYLHPTTWYTGASWNAPALHPVTSYLSRDAIGPQQANAFNIVGERISAPLYQQMSAGAFVQEGGLDHPKSQKAFAIAYRDVKAAFDYFLEHHWDGKRGIILSGHSQGSVLLEKLLKEYFDGKELHKKLVAAYLPGWTIFRNQFSNPNRTDEMENRVTVCSDEDSLGCVISWRTFDHGGDPTAFLHVESSSPNDKPICINPLSWKLDGEYAGSEKNLGGLCLMHPWTMWEYIRGVKDSKDRIVLPSLTPNVADAECRDGNLFINPPSRTGNGWYIWPSWHFASFPGLNKHPYDYNYFFANIRSNVETRVKAFLKRNN